MKLKAYIDSSLFDRDLRFYDIKRRMESLRLDFVDIKDDSTIVFHDDNIHEGQWSFWFDEKIPDENLRSFNFSSENFNEVEKVIPEIAKWYLLYSENQKEQAIAESLELVRNFDINSFKIKHGEEAYFRFLLQYLSWYASSEWEFSLKDVSNTLSELARSMDIDLEIIPDISSEVSKESNRIILQLPDDVLVSIHSSSLECSLVVGQIILGTLKSYSNEEEESEILSWDYVLGKLNFPVALFSKEDGNMVLHGQGFSRLKILPSECLVLENGATKEIDGKTYEVIKDCFNFSGHSYFALSFVGKNSHNAKLISSEELGIISSSIAHELNNPIAGILASIALLQLEDDLPDDTEKTLKDMEEGAKRCRDLIQVFLGFTKEGTQNYTQRRIQDSFKQSLDMLRFRMVESDCRINFQRSSESVEFKRCINPSIMTMILYLLMNEVLTSYSHFQLIKEEQLETINGKMKEYEDRMVFKFENVNLKSFAERVQAMKLLHHLFDLSLLELTIENDRITLKDRISMSLF